MEILLACDQVAMRGKTEREAVDALLAQMPSLAGLPGNCRPRPDRRHTGKPQLAGMPGWHWNASHSGGLVMVALAPFPLGLDLELQQSGRDLSVIAHHFLDSTAMDQIGTPPEAGRFYPLWTRREAWIKLYGKEVWEIGAAPDSASNPGEFLYQGSLATREGERRWSWALWALPKPEITPAINFLCLPPEVRQV